MLWAPPPPLVLSGHASTATSTSAVGGGGHGTGEVGGGKGERLAAVRVGGVHRCDEKHGERRHLRAPPQRSVRCRELEPASREGTGGGGGREGAGILFAGFVRGFGPRTSHERTRSARDHSETSALYFSSSLRRQRNAHVASRFEAHAYSTGKSGLWNAAPRWCSKESAAAASEAATMLLARRIPQCATSTEACASVGKSARSGISSGSTSAEKPLSAGIASVCARPRSWRLSCCRQRECTVGTWVGATVGRGEGGGGGGRPPRGGGGEEQTRGGGGGGAGESGAGERVERARGLRARAPLGSA